MRNFLEGVTVGLPLMLTLGPISILLINQGMDSGRSGFPAAIGVASADLTFSTVAAVAGSALVSVLAPLTPVLRAIGAAVIVGLALKLALEARSQVNAVKQGEGGGPTFAPSRSFTGLNGGRLVGAFYGLTIVNPVSVLLMSAVVVAGGAGTGTAGWVIGMTAASLMAHGGYVVFGSFVRKVASPMAIARMGMFSAVTMVGVAAHLLVG